jgi:hypothetical protein
MTHLSSTQLHEIQYGFRPPPAHLDGCPECQKVLKGIRDENTALRGILQEGTGQEAARPVERARFGRLGLGIAAAAGFLTILFYLLYSPLGRDLPTAGDSPEKVFQAIEERILKASTLRVTFIRQSAGTGAQKEREPLDSGSLLLGKGDRLSLILREPATGPPGGFDSEKLTISDGKMVVAMLRDGGMVWKESQGIPSKGLRERVASSFTRGGIDNLTTILPAGMEPRNPKSAGWNVLAPSKFVAGEGGEGSKTLAYRLGDNMSVKLWYDPRSLRLLKVLAGGILETYAEFSFDPPIRDQEFSFPPGLSEFLGVTVSLAEYLDLLGKGEIKELWITEGELTADLAQSILRKGESHRKVRADLPDGYRDPRKRETLCEGIDSGLVHREHLKSAEIPPVEVHLEEYLELSQAHKVHEVWIEGNWLDARLVEGIPFGGKVYRRVHALIPPAYLELAEGIKKLTEGIDPEHVHLDKPRR